MITNRRMIVRWMVCFMATLIGEPLSGFADEKPAASPANSSADSIADFLSQPRFKHAHWGLLFVDQDSGETVYELNPDKLFVPASTTKLFSVACALDTFGPDHRFETRLYRRGAIQDGELIGNLILVASGDLTFGGRTTDSGEIAFTNNDHTYANGSTDGELTAPDPLAGLNELARQVAAGGIKRLRGDVLIDDRLFDKAEATGSGPSRLTPIMVNDNLIDFTIEPTEPGQPAKVTWRPQSARWSVDITTETVAKAGTLETTIRETSPGRLQITGKIPVGHKPVVRVFEAPDAAAFARGLLLDALERAGVEVVPPPAVGNPPPLTLPPHDGYGDLSVVAKFVSPPFAEHARLILKVSHNLHASTLPLLVAAKHGQRTLADGLHRQHDFLAKAGVDVETISFGGGAGGARADFVTPRAAVQLLRHMATRPDFAAYERALPSLGVDGTLAKAVSPESPARDKAHAKTGTFYTDNVMNKSLLLTSKAMAGYLTTAKGHKLAFAMYVNNVHLRDGLDTKSLGRDLGRVCELAHERF